MLYLGRMYNPVIITMPDAWQQKLVTCPPIICRILRRSCVSIRKLPLCFTTTTTAGRFSLEATSDAAMYSMCEGEGSGYFLKVRRLGDIVHPINWCARKLHRIARRSCTAELLAASDATSTLIYLKTLLSELVYTNDAALLLGSRELVNL